MGSILKSVFLHLYAANLSRSYRNSPADACADSEIQITTMILLLLGGGFLAAGALFFPSFLQRFVNGGSASIGVLVALTVAVAYVVHACFGKYEKEPHLAYAYNSPKTRIKARALFWGFAVCWVLIAILALA